MTMTTPAQVLQGHRDEDRVRVELEERGYAVVPFGQRMLDPNTCPEYGDDTVAQAVRADENRIRHAPEWLCARPGGRPFLVEVIRNGYDNDARAVEVAKLVADDWWCRGIPVLFVDVGHWTAWEHTEARWVSAIARGNVETRGRGTGDPYALIRRDDERPFHVMFGGDPIR